MIARSRIFEERQFWHERSKVAAHSNRTIVYVVPRTWLGRLLAAVGTIALIILAVFFFTIFLTVFIFLAVVIIARILWAQYRTRQKASKRVIDIEYREKVTETRRRSEDARLDFQRPEDEQNYRDTVGSKVKNYWNTENE